MQDDKNRTAVIDIGTLKTKFVIAEYDNYFNRKVLFKDKKLTVIGRDLDKTDNMIIQKSIDKELEALNEMMEKIKEFGVTKYMVIGTEALRRAKNANEVLKLIEEITKVPTEILSHENEATIYFNAVANDIDGDLAVADTGGGSVQLTVGNKDKIDNAYLLKTGIYVLQEEFGQSHHPTKEDQDRAWDHVRREVNKLNLTKQPDLKFVYGSTNIIQFLIETEVNLKEDNHSAEHPYTTTVQDLMNLYDKLMDYSYEERMAFYPSEPYFMWGADKAIMNIVTLCKALGVNEIIPSNMNISDGLLLSLVRTN